MTACLTSKIAYKELIESGKDKTQRAKILQCLIEKGQMSRRNISMHTGIEINAVCGRVNELLAAKVIDEGEIERDYFTGKLVKPLKAI